jgi:hypothetical protein
MAKLTVLQMVNNVLQNLGEPSNLTALTGLTGIQREVFDALNDGVVVISEYSNGQLIPLETIGEITLANGTKTYAVPGSFRIEDERSFRCASEEQLVPFVSPEEMDAKNPHISATGDIGYPRAVTRFGDKFRFDKFGDTNVAGDKIYYRFWKLPTIFSTSTATGTSWIPEGWDRSVLVNWATYKVMLDHGKPQATHYFQKVFGVDGTEDVPRGSLGRMIRQVRSPLLRKIPVTAVF